MSEACLMLGSVTLTTKSYVFVVTFLCLQWSELLSVADISLNSNNSGVVFIPARIQYLVYINQGNETVISSVYVCSDAQNTEQLCLEQYIKLTQHFPVVTSIVDLTYLSCRILAVHCGFY